MTASGVPPPSHFPPSAWPMTVVISQFVGTYLMPFHGPSTGLVLLFQVPVSSLSHLSVHPTPSGLPWGAWSKDVYFFNKRGEGMSSEMSGGRLIHMTPSSGWLWTLSLFDLNRSRAGAAGMTRVHSSVDDHQLERVKESATFPLGSVQVASRSLNLKECRLQDLICDDEHVIIHAAPIRTTSAHNGDKLIILSF
ncbi:hypothetical protein BS47DRAFT_1139548 [Hydnum rufescens UP504]|uniref:Uncharacterized protein n=1 Tax=Hydnum rufescens UP504 TaxID=1448309 RepID=A0A9P6ATH1_9AGAM|nr:hypothetical protein BS47DRAFT_1139548 [Hydnum rufescens UP504]